MKFKQNSVTLDGYMPFIINEDGNPVHFIDVKTGSVALVFESEKKAKLTLDDYLRTHPSVPDGGTIGVSVDITFRESLRTRS